MKLILRYIFFFVLFAILGFSREFLFVNINQYLYSLYYHFPNPYLPQSLEFIRSIDYVTLYYSKFALTIIYFFAYFFTTYYTIKTFTRQAYFLKTTIYLFVFILIISSLLTLYNYYINQNLGGQVYTLSRWFMGIAQSPLIAFFIIAASKLSFKKKADESA